MSEHVCKCGTLDEPHPTYGGCLRAKGIGYMGVFSSRSAGAGRGERSVQKKWDRELAAYDSARKQGVQPAGTQMHQVEQAMRLSDQTGRAFDAGAGGFLR